jgi:hypothetical protein
VLSNLPESELTDGAGWGNWVRAKVMEDCTADWFVDDVMTDTGAGAAGVRRMDANDCAGAATGAGADQH